MEKCTTGSVDLRSVYDQLLNVMLIELGTKILLVSPKYKIIFWYPIKRIFVEFYNISMAILDFSLLLHLFCRSFNFAIAKVVALNHFASYLVSFLACFPLLYIERKATIWLYLSSRATKIYQIYKICCFYCAIVNVPSKTRIKVVKEQKSKFNMFLFQKILLKLCFRYSNDLI